MGRKKNKWFKKVVSFYRLVFKFFPPFQIICDGNFLATLINKKLEIKETLTKYLEENIHLIIPSCILHEIQSLGDKLQNVKDKVLMFKVTECQHGQILSPDQCIKTYIGKKNHKKYFVATQDSYLRKQLRLIPGVPLLFFDQNMILIDKPSYASMEAYKKREELKAEPKAFEKENIKDTKIKEANQFMKEEYKKSDHYKRKVEELKLLKVMGRVKKIAKGPNPLSVKKKKVKEYDTNNVKKDVERHNNNNVDNVDGDDSTVRQKKRQRYKKNKQT